MNVYIVFEIYGSDEYLLAVFATEESAQRAADALERGKRAEWEQAYPDKPFPGCDWRIDVHPVLEFVRPVRP